MKTSKLILGIETSCDETGASIIEAFSDSSKVKLLSNVIASSLSMHSKTGGIIPENAAREQVKFINPVIKEALKEANKTPNEIDEIAVTYGPGLIGSLLIGVETAKTLSLTWNKPLIPTNHLLGHIYANFIDTNQGEIEFPAISLIVSGGHTDLLLIESHKKIKWLGGTKDDAAGEALDKIGRLLNLPYPGGPFIEKRAKEGNDSRFNFPHPLFDSSFDFSFSGLKSAVMREVQNKNLSEQDINDICANVQKVVIDILLKKSFNAAAKYNAKSYLLGGGVAANQKLRDSIQNKIDSEKLNIKFFAPPKNLCTDNGAMIGAAAYFTGKEKKWHEIDADPNLYFDIT